MFAPNFAGVTCHVEHFEKLQEGIDAVNETYNSEEPHKGPLEIYVDSTQSPFVAAFCKSVDSMPMSELIRRLTVQDIPHRITGLPCVPADTYESFSGGAMNLSVHMRPCDMIYVSGPELTDKQVTIRVDGTLQAVKRMVVVGPHREARKVYRWTAWWLRDKKELDSKWVEGQLQRQVYGKLYIQLSDGKWVILTKGQCFDSVPTENLFYDTFTAKLNGLTTIDL